MNCGLPRAMRAVAERSGAAFAQPVRRRRNASRAVLVASLIGRRCCSTSRRTNHSAAALRSSFSPAAASPVVARALPAAVAGLSSAAFDLNATLRAELEAHLAAGRTDAVNVVNLAELARQHARWQAAMPRVRPFYAVKSNDNRELLGTLAALGIGFDCASPAEIDRVLSLGVAPSDVVYANPCKQREHIHLAAEADVAMTVFDCEEELVKIAEERRRLAPGVALPRMLLRLLPDDSRARCRLGQKYGADAEDVPALLAAARRLGLGKSVVGVAFHVGSGNDSAQAYADAVHMAAGAFREARDLGFDFNVLDIGGGFPETTGPEELGFERIAAAVNASLEAHFPAHSGVDVIAEPGRYYSGSSHTLVCQVIGRRQRSAREVQYFINQSIYGSFNCIMFDHAEVAPKLRVVSTAAAGGADANANANASASIWGQTCDGLDCIVPTDAKLSLPELQIGDWIAFEGMGAYTSSAGSAFNGFDLPATRYVCDATSVES